MHLTGLPGRLQDSNHLWTITKSDAIYVLLLVWKMALKMSFWGLSFCQRFGFQTVLKHSGGHPVHGSQRWSETTWVHLHARPQCTKNRCLQLVQACNTTGRTDTSPAKVGNLVSPIRRWTRNLSHDTDSSLGYWIMVSTYSSEQWIKM